MKHHTVTLALALDVGRQVETDGAMTDGVHRLGVKEVMWSSWNRPFELEKTQQSKSTRGRKTTTSQKVDQYIRNDLLDLFFSRLRLLMPALEGESSLSLAWLDSLEELWELK